MKVRWLACAALSFACDGGDEPFFPENFETSYREVRDCRFSIEHDGVSVTVFADPVSREPYVGAAYPLPEGSVIVKKLHADTACSDLVGYAVMRKLEGTWSWQMVGADRKVDETADPSRCINCHIGCTEGRDLTCTDP